MATLRRTCLVIAGSMLGGFMASRASAQTAPSPGEPRQPQAQSPAPLPAAPPATLHREGSWFGESGYRSPGLAVALSLTPAPVDFGNLYAENIGWGVVYTAAEVALMAPMMWLAGGHMGHGSDGDRRWSDRERDVMIGLATGYVAVKLVAGVHAGHAARELNLRRFQAPYAMVVPASRGATAMAGLRF
jgi:hypothetical protein